MCAAHRLLNDVEAFLVNLKRGHFLNDLLQQDVLLVIVPLYRELEQKDNVSAKIFHTQVMCGHVYAGLSTAL